MRRSILSDLSALLVLVLGLVLLAPACEGQGGLLRGAGGAGGATTACLPDNSPCTGSSDCCIGQCGTFVLGSSAGTCCLIGGSSCTSSSQCCGSSDTGADQAECCNGVCMPVDLTNANCCFPDILELPCTSNSQCCDDSCVDGRCNCVNFGGACTSSAQCCCGYPSVQCGNGETPVSACTNGVCCLPDTWQCTSSSQCCGGSCTNGSCCLPNGSHCTANPQCCGLCDGSTGTCF